MRAALLLGTLAGLGIATACIPHPEADFEDYQKRIAGFTPPSVDPGDAGPTIEAGPPPTEAKEGTYYASCRTELATQTSKIFSFWVSTSFTPNADPATGGRLSLVLEALKLEANRAPAKVSRAGITGGPLPEIVGDTDPSGSFTALLDPTKAAVFPGDANPISGSNVRLVTQGAAQVGLKGKFAESRFCARLTGRVVEPAAAARDLDPESNFCVFVPATEGMDNPALTYTAADYSAANCPY